MIEALDAYLANAATFTTQTQKIINSQTPVAGGSAITLSGPVVSLDTSGESVVVGGSTVAVSNILSFQGTATTSAAGIGGL